MKDLAETGRATLPETDVEFSQTRTTVEVAQPRASTEPADTPATYFEAGRITPRFEQILEETAEEFDETFRDLAR